MIIGEKIRFLRQQNQLTQEELADRCELSKGFISLLERDMTSPSISTLKYILEELGNTDKIDLQYVLPEGSNWSVDLMCIPQNAKNVAGAHAFINYMYDEQIALSNCEYVGYSTPNVEAKALLADEVRNNKSYYPDAATFKTLEIFYSSSTIEEAYTALWNTVKASS